MNTLKVMITPYHPLSDPNLLSILRKSSDRRQLKWLDKQMLLCVSQKATGQKSRRALRQLSFRRLLEEHPLSLMEHLRNTLRAL